MCDEDSDGVPYDEDFEEASDDDRGKSFGENQLAMHPVVETKTAVQATSKPPRRPRPSEQTAPATPFCAACDDKGLPSFGSDALELTRAGSAGSAAGQRVVRGKVSVGSDDAGFGRPGSGEFSSLPSQTPQGNNNKPVWLQFGNTTTRPLSRDAAAGYTPESGMRLGRLAKPPIEGELVANNHLEPPRMSLRRPASGSGRSSRSVNVSTTDDSLDVETGRRAGVDDRKVKRLQQEIQRLTQRLAEAELFSAQDDMLPRFALEEVEIGCQIAQGGFSSVHHATWRSTPCALKKIFDPVITEELRSEFENEVKMLRLMRHPHIVTLMAVCRVPPALSILTEYVGGGSIFDILHGPQSLRRRDHLEPEPARIFPLVLQVAGALAYLHSMLVVHRDIKSQNVLLTEGPRPAAKLCDFGLARMRSELCTGTLQWAGTACYMAPELFAKKRYNEMVDVFAFGTMVWEVASTEIPHANMDPADIAHRVSKDGACLVVVHSWPKTLKALLRSTLMVQAESRPSMVDVAQQLGKVIMEFPSPD